MRDFATRMETVVLFRLSLASDNASWVTRLGQTIGIDGNGRQPANKYIVKSGWWRVFIRLGDS